MPSSPVRRWFGGGQKNDNNNSVRCAWKGEKRSLSARKETTTKNATQRQFFSFFRGNLTHSSSLCVPFQIFISGGSTRIDRRSDCRRKHADALFAFESSDVFFADVVVGVGVDVVVVVVVVVPRRPLILLFARGLKDLSNNGVCCHR